FLIGGTDQNSRCAAVTTYGFEAGLLAAVVVDPFHGAPALTQATSASTSSGFSFPPFGIFSASVCRTARISRLFSASPGTIAGPDLPPFSSASRESTRKSAYC